VDRADAAAIAEPKPLTLSGEWSIDNAEELRKFLADSLESGPDVILDLSGVLACDTAGLQLICSLRQTAVQRGGRLRIAALSPAIEETAAALGLPIPELMEGSGRGL
jgi:anti-anti-sigma factor